MTVINDLMKKEICRRGDRIFHLNMGKVQKNSFYIESLGCAKNSVDSRAMAELLVRNGFVENGDPNSAEILIVNTCGFIQPARVESLHVLNEFAAQKPEGQILIAAGCLSEREKSEILNQVKGLDAAFGTRRWADIIRVVEKARGKPDSPYLHFPITEKIIDDDQGVPQVAIQGRSAYLKIADGCDRGCAFCAIPVIKGPMVSRPMDQVVKDARILEELGVKEIILIAQDSTAYGRDCGMRDGLVLLLPELINAVPDVPWLRVMYTFPGAISDELIQLMAGNKQILPYLDIPLQHAHPDVLRRMGRPVNVDWIRKTIAKMRTVMPEISLRTTFITGFPDETEEEFNYLLEFIREIRFDHVGIFPYYHEESTSAYSFVDSVSTEEKNRRIQMIAAAQEEISLQINKGFVGKKLDVLIEGNGDGISAGRSYRDAPEIDGLVIFDEIIQPGEMATGQITGALIHDLIAKRI